MSLSPEQSRPASLSATPRSSRPTQPGRRSSATPRVEGCSSLSAYITCCSYCGLTSSCREQSARYFSNAARRSRSPSSSSSLDAPPAKRARQVADGAEVKAPFLLKK